MKHGSGGIVARVLPTVAVAMMGCLACDVGLVSANAPMETPTVTYTLDAHIVASGSSATSSNACYRLRATIGEPVAGYAANADHALSAGFRAIAQGQPGDDLFFSGFEACP